MTEERTNEDNTKKELSELQEKFSKLQEQFQQSLGTIDTLKQEKQALELNTLADPNYLSFLQSKQGNLSSESEDTTDFDDLTGAELFRKMEKVVSSKLEALQQAHASEVSELKNQLHSAVAKLDLTATKASNPDFARYLEDSTHKKRAIEISNENPTWDAAKVAKQLSMEIKLAEFDQKSKLQEEEKLAEKAKSEKDGISEILANSKELSNRELVMKADELVSSGRGVLDTPDVKE